MSLFTLPFNSNNSFIIASVDVASGATVGGGVVGKSR